ncbi:cloroquine resistance associated protein Cg3 [Plasmodium cynomolgi strain B]|uniref:Cloroquine resistance associated protein Cg3 n=1 Tax=Plasmodium cynomolgi (strain B) TaxID=1120755 RepID=K6V5N1_PLACD|nr:cloroquine resistance associated protein Cg3 [Plasmodium cynomolgi strain B]GAB64427.1 cloroquine resistance associated protein Cg3 [Plasmodium cynomolgi strain B]
MKRIHPLSVRRFHAERGRGPYTSCCSFLKCVKRLNDFPRWKWNQTRIEEKGHRYFTTNRKDPPPKEIKKKSVFLTWRCLGFNLALSLPILYFYLLQCERKKNGKGQIGLTKVENIGVPLIGGDFTLFNHDGKVVRNEDFKKKFCLIYFGFTYCPDICPQELEKQTIVIEKIVKKYGDIITPVFISVDPNRDTLAQVKHYCSSFSDKLVGLTGTKEQIKKVAKLFRVYYNEHVVADQGTKTDTQSGDSPVDNNYNYLIDHSIIHYLLDVDGKFVDFFGKNCTTSEMVERISHYVDLHLQNGATMAVWFDMLTLSGLPYV